MSDERCKKELWPGWHTYQCENKAKRDGWCGIHHPDAVAKRRAKSDAKYKAQREDFVATQAVAARDRERLAHYPKLVESLRPLAEQDCESWGCDIANESHLCPPTGARTVLTEAAAIEKRKGGRDG